jgi:GT2 family glycosyltransferase
VHGRHGSARLTLLESEAVLPLSQARNLALRWLVRQNPAPGSVVAFPDDDCWYVAETLARVDLAFADRPDAGAVTGCYGPSEGEIDRERFPAGPGDLRASTAVRRVSSVTMFVRAECALRIGGFNPILGAGTPVMGGEDTDYVLRLIEAGCVMIYRPDVVVGHAYSCRGAKSYAGAFVLVLASHSVRSPGLLPVLVRGLFGSMRMRHGVDGLRRFQSLKYLSPTGIRAVIRARPAID